MLFFHAEGMIVPFADARDDAIIVIVVWSIVARLTLTLGCSQYLGI